MGLLLPLLLTTSPIHQLPGPLTLLFRFLALNPSYCPKELSTSDVPGIHPCGSRPLRLLPLKALLPHDSRI